MPRANYMKVGALLFLAGMMVGPGYGQEKAMLEKSFLHPPASAKPWVSWYWTPASVSKEGIRADLEAMKEEGIGGVYLMPVKGGVNKSLMRFARQEAGRLGLQFVLDTSSRMADISMGAALDAISEAHIYGKPVVQAEGFRELKMTWDEYPGMLKTLQDRNYALGINRLVFPVFTHNPRMDRRPGMMQDGVGLYFQRDQTWWKPAKAWIDYTQRCQWLLQQGRPVADIAVLTGKEIPCRSILPDRLVSTLPGLFGKEVVARKAKRGMNKGEDPEDWIDPLHGYAYDCLNPDVLIRLATVDKGQIVLPGGGRYSVLVLPGAHPLSPDPSLLPAKVAEKLLQLVQDGATLLTNKGGDADQLGGGSNIGKGRVIKGPFRATSFDSIRLEKDLIALESDYRWANAASSNDTGSSTSPCGYRDESRNYGMQ